jgi:hypothetical protein
LGKTLVKLSGSRTVKNKFYADLPSLVAPSPELYKKSVFFIISLHLLNYILSQIKLSLLKIKNDIIIDDDGYLLKALADLHYPISVNLHSLTGIFLKTVDRLLAGSFKINFVSVVYVKGLSDSLKTRYLGRQSGIEPPDYIDFQNQVYEKFSSAFASANGVVLTLDASKPIELLHSEVCLITKLTA